MHYIYTDISSKLRYEIRALNFLRVEIKSSGIFLSELELQCDAKLQDDLSKVKVI